MLILLDNGHGIETKGKRSPDSSLLEYKWARQFVDLLSARLAAINIPVYKVTPEDNDTDLKTRVRRANFATLNLDPHDCLLISVHVDAEPLCDSKWGKARGFSVYVSPNASQFSRTFASIIHDECRLATLLGNRCIGSVPYHTGNFAIIRDTKVPAVLTENLFMTNQADVQFLNSRIGQEKLCNVYIKAIQRYFNIDS